MFYFHPRMALSGIFTPGSLTDGWKNISVASIASDIPPFGSAPAAYIGIAVADTLAVNQSM